MSPLQRLFRNYTQDKVSAEEKELVETWYESYDQVEDLPIHLQHTVRERLWKNLQLQLDLPGVKPTGPDKTARIPHWRIPLLRRFNRYGVAASIVGLTLLTTTLIFHSRHKPGMMPAYADIHTGKGQMKKVQLPDGSVITLDPGSFIQFDKSFEGPTREIFMQDGEAWYDIASDHQRPFIIHAGKLNIRVLGTAFSIRTIRGAAEQTVLIREGKVQVEQDARLLGILTAGKQLVYDNVSGKARIYDHKELSAERASQGWLVLDNTSYAVMQAIISNKYNIKISDSHHKLTMAYFTASFRPDASLQDVMRVLCAIHKVQFTISTTNNQVNIY